MTAFVPASRKKEKENRKKIRPPIDAVSKFKDVFELHGGKLYKIVSEEVRNTVCIIRCNVRQINKLYKFVMSTVQVNPAVII